MKTQVISGTALMLLLSYGAVAQNSSFNQNPVPVGGMRNAGFGVSALNPFTFGKDNTATGHRALSINNSGDKNTATGSGALQNNTNGTENTATGTEALFLNDLGSNNTSHGAFSLYSNTIGNHNTALGYGADVSANNLTNATAIGANANVTTSNAMQLGDGNVTQIFAGTGTNAKVIAGGLQITGGSLVTGHVLTSDAFGNATWQLPSGSGGGWSLNGSNAFFGFLAGNAITSGGNTTGIGSYALYANTTGYANTATGHMSLYYNTSGFFNTALGYYAMEQNTTGIFNTAIGARADVGSGGLSYATALGCDAIVNTSNKIRLGNSNVTVVEGPVIYTTSDARFKTNVKEDEVKGIEFIKLLRPVVYNFDCRKFTEFLTKNMPDSISSRHLEKDFSAATAIRQSGFIAQEVEKAAEKIGYNFNGLHKPIDENDNYSLSYAQFVVPLVKAVQEQQQMIENQQQEINALKSQLNSSSEPKTSGLNQTSNIDGLTMSQNIPNPFTNETLVKYTLPQTVSQASMVVYDLTGKQITSFPINKNNSSVTITSEKLSAGIYIYSIVADGQILDSKRMVVAEK